MDMLLDLMLDLQDVARRPRRGWAMRRCQDCKQRKPDVKRRHCPYQKDVNNKTVWVTLCDDCTTERAGDI